MKRLLRVTQLEKFRRYITEHSEYDDERSVIDNLTGQFTGNQYTRVGTAFHKIVEGDTLGCKKIPGTETEIPGREFDIDGYPVKLDLKQCKTALEYKDRFPNAYHEIREYMDMGEIVITGCADIINGLEIRDIKTKYSPIKDSDYTDSCQWRFYMELFGVGDFFFDLFQFVGYDKDKHGYDVRGLELKPYAPAIGCHWYNTMEQDNRILLKEFVQWSKFRGLFDNLPIYKS